MLTLLYLNLSLLLVSGNAPPSVFNALDTPPTPPDNCDATIDLLLTSLMSNTPCVAPVMLLKFHRLLALLMHPDTSLTLSPKLPVDATDDIVPDTTAPNPPGASLPVIAPTVCNAFCPFCNVDTTLFACADFEPNIARLN